MIEKISNLNLKKKNSPINNKILFLEQRIKDESNKLKEAINKISDKLSNELEILNSKIEKMGNGNGKNEKTLERIGILSSKKADLRDVSEKKKEELKERFLKQKNELEKKIQGYQEK